MNIKQVIYTHDVGDAPIEVAELKIRRENFLLLMGQLGKIFRLDSFKIDFDDDKEFGTGTLRLVPDRGVIEIQNGDQIVKDGNDLNELTPLDMSSLKTKDEWDHNAFAEQTWDKLRSVNNREDAVEIILQCLQDFSIDTEDE